MIILRGGEALTDSGWHRVDVVIDQGLIQAIGETHAGGEVIEDTLESTVVCRNLGEGL